MKRFGFMIGSALLAMALVFTFALVSCDNGTTSGGGGGGGDGGSGGPYTITYLPGANGTGSITAGSKIHDLPFTLSTLTFSRANYTQTGWSTIDGGAKAYNLGGIYSANASITLYPFWTVNGGGGGGDGGGDGSPDNPFQVYDVATLKKVGTETTAGGWTLSAYYEQTDNINMTGQSWTPIGPPISYGGESYPFTGSYNGDIYEITNFAFVGSVSRFQGLFSNIGEEGVVQNVTLTGCNLTGYHDVYGFQLGAIAAKNSGLVENCSVTGTVSGDSGLVGGLIASNYGTVQNCSVNGVINGDGGLVGANYGTILDCSVEASVTGGAIGGIAGINFGGIIKNCFTTGEITSTSKAGGIVGDNFNWDGEHGIVEYCFSTGNVSGSDYVGGIAGYIGRSSYDPEGATVQKCYTTGKITGTDRVGGIAGENYIGLVRDCYATGNIIGNGAFGGNIGGVVGENNYGTDSTQSGRVENCYATGSVGLSSDMMEGGVGGIVGYNTNYSAVQNCVGLNSGVSSSVNSFFAGRVIGLNAGTGYNNYGRSNMAIGGSSYTPEIALNKKDGDDITPVNAIDPEWWDANMHWNWDETWNLPSGDNLPTLKSIGGTQEPQLK